MTTIPFRLAKTDDTSALSAPESPLDTQSVPVSSADKPEPPMLGESPRHSSEPACLGSVEGVVQGRVANEVLDSADELGAAAFRSTVASAARAVIEAVLADVESGCLPQPADDPLAIEAALTARTQEVLLDGAFWRYFTSRGAFAVLRYAECGPVAFGGASWKTPLAASVELEPLRAPLRESPATSARHEVQAQDVHAAGEGSLLVLRPGAPAPSEALGLAPYVRWDHYAFRVVRDEILVCVREDLRAQRELRVRRTPSGAGFKLPCYVGESPAPAPTPAEPPKRRRKR